jgi:hypothetical protein
MLVKEEIINQNKMEVLLSGIMIQLAIITIVLTNILNKLKDK